MIIEDALLITSFMHNSVHSVKWSSLVEKMFLRYFVDNSRTRAQHVLNKETPLRRSAISLHGQLLE